MHLGFLPPSMMTARMGARATLRAQPQWPATKRLFAGWVEAGVQRLLSPSSGSGAFLCRAYQPQERWVRFNRAFDKRKLTTFADAGERKEFAACEVKEWPKLNTVEKWDGGEAPTSRGVFL